MSDRQLVEFVEKHGVQVWPQRQRGGYGPSTEQRVRRIPGEILNWTAQFAPTPFIQCTASTWRRAVSAIKEAYEKHTLTLTNESAK